MSKFFLETDRLYLRNLEDADFADYAIYATDDEISRMMGRSILRNEAEIRQNFNYLKDKAPRCYGLIFKATGQLIGNLSIEPVPAALCALETLRGKAGATLSFCVRRDHQRKGLMREVLDAVIQQLFTVERLDFVQCGCFAFNIASEKLQRSLGFVPLTQLHVSTPDGEMTTHEFILWNPQRKRSLMKPINKTTWPRAELFDFFSAVSYPFYSVTFRVDVTNLHRYTKTHGLSFYYSLSYLVAKAVNAVENFRYTIREGEIYLLDQRIPSLTDLHPGSEQFHIVTLPLREDMAAFCAAVKARSEAQTTLLDQDDETDALIYISCTPWFDLTGCTNERDFDRDDAIPRITWGKYVETNGRETLGMSLEVNHRFIDGYHLGQFYQKLQASIDAL